MSGGSDGSARAGEAAPDDPAVPTDGPVLLFDGVCDLCNGLVRWVVERDPGGTFRFASLQSAAGQAILESHGLPTDDFDTFVMAEGDRYYTKSTAALEVLRRLGFPYALAYPFVAVPRPLRDRFYDLVADRRYGWFGRRDSCMVPGPELETRFLE